jgi:acyl-CoA reductase-like NAD-dependent aldehyde dehydrogenase
MSPSATRKKATGSTASGDQRIEVRKTYKLYIGGAFPRSESGRTYEIRAAGPSGRFLANAAMGSRKDGRDAVVAARGAFEKWAGATAYNRGQVFYRVAELMEGRRDQFAADVAAAEGLTPARADKVVSQAIDRWVWYAGWSDKIAQVLGGVNPVAGPYFNISTPEPTGVVAALAPQRSSLLGLVCVLAPIVISGNTAVVLTSERRPLPAVTLSEVLATSDVPAGVINMITGRTAEVAPWLASHQDVNAIDLTGAAHADGLEWGQLERAAADNLKRVLRPAGNGAEALEPDWTPVPTLTRIRAYLETKTVWHPKGR